MRSVSVIAVLAAVLTASVDAQTIRIDVGRTSSGVAWLRSPPTPCEGGCMGKRYSSTDRKSFTISATFRHSLRTWLAGEVGVGLVPKGFEVTSPTFHMLYLEAPLAGVLHTGPAGGLFLDWGIVLGVRVACRQFMPTVSGYHEDGCGRTITAYGRELEAIRRWDMSWRLGVGGRVPLPRGRLVATISGQSSLVDIQPDALRKMVNRVIVFTLGYEWEMGASR